MSDRTTLYVSSKDRALRVSAIIYKGDRAGCYPPIMTVDGIDTVKVSKIDVTVLGHNYIGEAQGVLSEMFHVLKHGKEAPGLQIDLRDHFHWRNGDGTRGCLYTPVTLGLCSWRVKHDTVDQWTQMENLMLPNMSQE